MFAADYPFLDVLWTMIIFFLWVAWIWILITIFADIFRRHDIGGWHKAIWIVFLIILPFLGVLIYLIAQGKGMAERKAEDSRAAKADFDDYVRSVAPGGGAGAGAATEIAKAKELLDSGAIDQAEYEQLKRQALA